MKLNWFFAKQYAKNMYNLFLFGVAAYVLVYSGKRIVRQADAVISEENSRTFTEYVKVFKDNQA